MTTEKTITMELTKDELLRAWLSTMDKAWKLNDDDKDELAEKYHDLKRRFHEEYSAFDDTVERDNEWHLPEGYKTMRDFAFGPSASRSTDDTAAAIADGGKKPVRSNYGRRDY